MNADELDDLRSRVTRKAARRILQEVRVTFGAVERDRLHVGLSIDRASAESIMQDEIQRALGET